VKDYGEDRNTWEPLEHLTTEWVKKKAERVKQKFLEERLLRSVLQLLFAATRGRVAQRSRI